MSLRVTIIIISSSSSSSQLVCYLSVCLVYLASMKRRLDEGNSHTQVEVSGKREMMMTKMKPTRLQRWRLHCWDWPSKTKQWAAGGLSQKLNLNCVMNSIECLWFVDIKLGLLFLLVRLQVHYSGRHCSQYSQTSAELTDDEWRAAWTANLLKSNRIGSNRTKLTIRNSQFSIRSQLRVVFGQV